MLCPIRMYLLKQLFLYEWNKVGTWNLQISFSLLYYYCYYFVRMCMLPTNCGHKKQCKLYPKLLGLTDWQNVNSVLTNINLDKCQAVINSPSIILIRVNGPRTPHPLLNHISSFSIISELSKTVWQSGRNGGSQGVLFFA